MHAPHKYENGIKQKKMHKTTFRFANHRFSKALLTRIHKELLELKGRKTSDMIKKQTNDWNKHLFEEYLCVAKKHMFIMVAHMEVHSKPNEVCHFSLTVLIFYLTCWTK